MRIKRIFIGIFLALAFLLSGCTFKIGSKPESPNKTVDLVTPNDQGTPNDPNSNSGIVNTNEDLYPDMVYGRVECAESYVADVYSDTVLNDNELVKAEYHIIQGKDGSKFSAALINDSDKNTYDLTVYNENGDNILSQSTYASYYGDILRIIDLNMDGHADIQFLKIEGTMNSIYDFYIWDAGRKNLIKAECDDDLAFVDIKVFDGYVQLWGRNDANSGDIVQYEWDGYKLVKILEDTYSADPETSSIADDEVSDGKWRFTSDDIKIKGKTIVGITYEQLLETFGQPVEIKKHIFNPMTSDPENHHNMFICVYDGFECNFYNGGDVDTPVPQDTVSTFDITGTSASLDCQLYIDLSREDLLNGFGVEQYYSLNDKSDIKDLNSIKTILTHYKPEGYYAEFSEAAIVYGSDDSAMVLLFYKDDISLYRIAFGYPLVN